VCGWLLVSADRPRAAQPETAPLVSEPIVFVSRQIPPNGSIYWNVPGDMPGVGPHSRFRVAAPGRLLVRDPDGSVRTLVDGAVPTPASLNLIDVNAPDVSYDGSTIVFAGLPAGTYAGGPVTNPGAWRLYRIRSDGSGLQQVTHSDQALDLSQFGPAAGGLRAYDDIDPAWLPDGRIVFSSTRWPSFAQYSGVRTTNLYVVNPDGSGLHRITAERNGADRPAVDPLTGRIVFARWWRNHRFALDSLATVADPNGGFVQKDGLTARRDVELTGSAAYADFLWRNAWNLAAINPDGTGLAAWGGSFLHEGDGSLTHAYGGAFASSGEFFANFFPMFNMTEAAGFGGVRRFPRGPEPFVPVIGVTSMTLDYVNPSNPTSYGIFRGSYAAEPAPLADGSWVVSWAAGVAQDYGLYTMNADGTGRTLLLDYPGTTELRARPVAARPLPPAIADAIAQAPSALPPSATGPYDRDGTFIFDALNVYANAPVDVDIVSAPAIGSAASIRFFIDHQRSSPGSFPNLDWPILIGELPVSGSGAVRHLAPANVPLFEQLRGATGRVPITRGPTRELGAAHVAGMNYGRPGSRARCVGCHIGHTMMTVPADDAEARWTNLAPGAQVTVSSTRDANQNGGLTDRRVMKGELWRYWASASGQRANQWVRLVFPVPIAVRSVRLYNPRTDTNSSIQVQSATVQVCADAACTTAVATGATGPLATAGTSVALGEAVGRAVMVRIGTVTGTFYGMSVASLAEVEVIGRGLDAPSGPAVPPPPTGVRIVR